MGLCVGVFEMSLQGCCSLINELISHIFSNIEVLMHLKVLYFNQFYYFFIQYS